MKFVQTVKKRWWDLQRFGLTPAKLLERLQRPCTIKVAALSIPKAGTHLLERVLCLCPGLHRHLLPTIHGGNLDRYGSQE